MKGGGLRSRRTNAVPGLGHRFAKHVRPRHGLGPLLALAGAGVAALGGWWVLSAGPETLAPVEQTAGRPGAFPWHLVAVDSPSSPGSRGADREGAVEGEPRTWQAVAPPPHDDLSMEQSSQARARALSEMGQGRFTAAWGFIEARDRCLMAAWASAEKACDPNAQARDDEAALALLEAGAGRCLPEAELALAEWWVQEAFRLSVMTSLAERTSAAVADSLPQAHPAWRIAAQRARGRAIASLAAAAPHNAEAAARLEELRTAWATLD